MARFAACRAGAQVLKIDLHTHILPEDWPSFGFPPDGPFPRLERTAPGCGRILLGGRPFREIGENCWCRERRLADCDAAGVDVQVLSTVPLMFSYWTEPAKGEEIARFLNDHIAGVVARDPHRFVGLGTLPMQDPDRACRELERCCGELRLAGVEIGTHIGRWNLSEPELFPVFETAERLGAAVFIHPWDMMGADEMRRYWLPWLVGMPAEASRAICSLIFGGVLERLPRLRVAIAHGGGAFPFTLGRIEHAFHARPDLVAVDNPKPPSAYLRRLYVDSLVHDARALRFLVDLFGPERIALGSDYPFPLGEPEPGRLIASLPGLDRAARERMLGGTALEFLGLAAGRFRR